MFARALPLACAAAFTLACAARMDPMLVNAPLSPERRWVSTLHREHPLVGRIWDVRAGAFIDEPALDAALVASPFVLLGEIHDNPDHHLLQARLVRAITASGRRPALAFEMLSTDQQALVDAAVARAPRDPDELGKAVGWNHSGWPEFEMYRPIFAAGLDAGLRIVAAELPRAKVKDAVRLGPEGLGPELRERLARDEPLPEPLVASLRHEMRESHCNELPEEMLDPLVLAQRARDAQMAERMAAAGESGAILVTGNGHARTDRGVPSVLGKDEPPRHAVSVALLEVDPEIRVPTGYAKEWGEGPLPFDFAVFTPGAEREDPCESLRRRRAKSPPAPSPSQGK